MSVIKEIENNNVKSWYDSNTLNHQKFYSHEVFRNHRDIIGINVIPTINPIEETFILTHLYRDDAQSIWIDDLEAIFFNRNNIYEKIYNSSSERHFEGIYSILNALEQAKKIKYNEENNVPDIPVPEFVWNLTKIFLISYTERVKFDYGISIEAPDITPLPNGSVDILWYSTKGKMLINVDNSTENKAYYYSDFHNKKNPIKGNVTIDKNDFDESLAIRLKNIFKND